MNCCNSYGECTQGHGCPVRMSPIVTHESDGVTVTEWHELEKEEIVMFEKPWQWLRDLLFLAVHIGGSVCLGVLLLLALVLATGLHRVIF